MPLRLGNGLITVSLIESDADGQSGVNLIYNHGAFGQELQVEVLDPDGVEMAIHGRSSRNFAQRMSMTWFIADLQPGTHYTVRVTTSEILSTPVIAVTIPVELP